MSLFTHGQYDSKQKSCCLGISEKNYICYTAKFTVEKPGVQQSYCPSTLSFIGYQVVKHNLQQGMLESKFSLFQKGTLHSHAFLFLSLLFSTIIIITDLKEDFASKFLAFWQGKRYLIASL